jgi:Family of unknown function (DUF6308)
VPDFENVDEWAAGGIPLRFGQMQAFALQFPIERVPEYAARFPSKDDDEALAIGRNARARGHYTLDEFRKVCRWKTPRSAPLVARNSAEDVASRTALALSETSSERERIDALRSLHGVGWPTASVLLHLAYPDRYPILDKRVVHALGAPAVSTYGLRFWEAFVRAWRQLAAQADVDGRTFDKALWQWSKEHDVPVR